MAVHHLKGANNLYSHWVVFFSIGGTYFYMSKILRLVKHVAASFASLLVQLFQMVLLKLGYEFRGTFSVVFLGVCTQPQYVLAFLTDFFSGTVVFFFYSFLAGACLFPFLNYYITVSAVLRFSCFLSALEVSGFTNGRPVTVKMDMFIFYLEVIEGND